MGSHCLKCGQAKWLPRILESVQKENEDLKAALKKILAEVGTSTLTHKIARDVLKLHS